MPAGTHVLLLYSLLSAHGFLAKRAEAFELGHYKSLYMPTLNHIGRYITQGRKEK